MKAYIPGTQPITLALLAGLMFAWPAPPAQAQSGQAPGDQNVAFRGTVTAQGDVRDSSGNTVGRIMMSNPGARFDMGTMSVNAQGNVVDSSGAIVGRMMFNSGQSGPNAAPQSYGQNYAPAYQNYAPPQNYAPAPQNYAPAPQGYAAPQGYVPAPQNYAPAYQNYAPPQSYSPAPQNYGSPATRIPNPSQQNYLPETSGQPPQASGGPNSNIRSFPPGTVLDTQDGKRLVFSTTDPVDMSKLTVDRSGRVFDATGKAVGRLSTGSGTSRNDGTERGVAPPLVTSPPRSVEQAPKAQSSRRTQDSAAVVEKSRSRGSTKASLRTDRARLLAAREEDLGSRRAKVAARIRAEFEEGRLTSEQEKELTSQLQYTVDEEQRFKRDKVLKDREMRRLYRQWDTLMSDMDEHLRRNARGAVGLRTR